MEFSVAFFYTNGTVLFHTNETTQKKTTISSFWPRQYPHFVSKNQQSASTVLFLDEAQTHARGPNHVSKRKTNVPTTKLNSFSPAGLQLCSKTSANTTNEKRYTLHRIGKRFGNLPLSFWPGLFKGWITLSTG